MKKLLGLLMMMVVGFSGCGGYGKGKLLVWTTTYDDESVEGEYQYYLNTENNKRMKEGWYNSYYKNGDYKEVGTYEEDKRDGEWIYHTEDGKETKGIYDNGKKDSGEFWIHVRHDSLGAWVETEDELWEDDEDEVYRGLFTYDDGLWNGLGVLYFEKGNKRGEGLFKDGKHKGYYKRFYLSGEVKWEGNYVDGKREGKSVDYYESGSVSWEGNWVDGEEEGKGVGYYESGEVKWEGNYVDGKFEGKWVRYRESGEVEWEGNYVGVEVRLGPGGEGKSVWYYQSGEIYREGNYVDGKKEGKTVRYYESGKVEWERNYVDGEEEGKSVWYDEDGNITDEDIYKDGECVEMCEGGE